MADDARRAEEARLVLANPLYDEAFRVIEERLVSELAKAEITAERAEQVRNLLVASRKHRQYLEQVIVTGKLVQINERQGLGDKLRRAFG